MKKVILKFLRFHCLDRDHCAIHYHHLVDRIIERFEKANPGIRIESTVMRNWYQLMHVLNNKLPTGETPDVFHTCGGGILQDLAARGLALDLSRYLDDGWRETFARASLYPLLFEDREYAVPLEQGFIFIWYNREIFEKFGFSPPGDFDGLLDICRSFRSAGILPFAVGNRERWPGAFFFSHLFHRIGGEDVFVCDFTKAPNYEAIRSSFIEAAGKLIELVRAGATHEEANYTNYRQQRDLFAQEKAAMQLNGNRLLDYLKTEGPGMLGKVGQFPFPLVDGGRGGVGTLFGGSLATYGVSANSKNKEEAVRFLKTLTDEDAARDVVFQMGDIPALLHVHPGEYPLPVHGEMAEVLAAADKLQVHYFKYLPPQPAAVYLEVVAKLFSEDISPDEAFRTVEEALARSAAGNNREKRSQQK